MISCVLIVLVGNGRRHCMVPKGTTIRELLTIEEVSTSDRTVYVAGNALEESDLDMEITESMEIAAIKIVKS